MKVQMIVGRSYQQVLQESTALQQQAPGITVTTEAIDQFRLLDAGGNTIYDSEGDGPIFLARVHSGVLP